MSSLPDLRQAQPSRVKSPINQAAKINQISTFNQTFNQTKKSESEATLHSDCDSPINQYTVSKTLGQGTFGKVKLSLHVQTQTLYAIKIIQKQKIKTGKQLNSVRREVRISKLLKHPNIVAVRETFEDDGNIYLVMELAEGGELFDWILGRGVVDETVARKFFRQVVSAIDYCHQNSIIHRDLKPEVHQNLLLDKENNIKIIDFGFGNTYHRNRTLDTYCGSPYYAAPEMVKGIPYVGPEVDIVHGIILYALLTSTLPFDSRDMHQLYALISRGEYAPVPSALGNSLVARLLAVDPNLRAKMPEIIAHPWMNIDYPRLDTRVIIYPVIILHPIPEAVAELVSYGINADEVKRLLRIDCGKHPIKSLYFLVCDYLERCGGKGGYENSSQDVSDIDTPVDAIAETADEDGFIQVSRRYGTTTRPFLNLKKSPGSSPQVSPPQKSMSMNDRQPRLILSNFIKRKPVENGAHEEVDSSSNMEYTPQRRVISYNYGTPNTPETQTAAKHEKKSAMKSPRTKILQFFYK